MEKLRKAIANGNLLLDLDVDNLESIFDHLLDRLIDEEIVTEEMRDPVGKALRSNELSANSSIGQSIAVPHVYLDGLTSTVVYFIRLENPLNLDAPDGVATRFFFFLLGPPGGGSDHLNTLAEIASLASDEEFRYEISKCTSKEEFLDSIEQSHHRHSSSDELAGQEKGSAGSEEGLEFTGKFCGGLRADIARRLPHYWSDITDGFHVKCLGSIFFLLFACLAPAVLFGGLMGDVTGGEIGVVEMILATAICGVIYSIFSGQPLIILGGTGPLLVFTQILYLQCDRLEIDFLATYAWVGIWSAGFLLLLTVLDGSFLMRYFTRFTDEIFAALISIIFIVEAVKRIIENFYDPETTTIAEPLFAVILAFGTYLVAMNLSRLRRSDYLRPRMREFLADFGPAIALVAMAVISYLMKDEVAQDYLPAPETFGTTSGRAWLVDLGKVEMWVRFVAIVPAILVTVLVYLDQNITARVVNSPDHKLHKGVAYHLDLGLVAILMAGCSFFGFPWLVAATVRSLNHLRSLATVDEVTDHHGHSHEQIIHVRENRVTGFTIHLAIGLVLFFMLDYLRMLPKATLYGLFLFMGVVSMSGNQFFERVALWVRDPAMYPTTHYIRRVPLKIIHAFSALQVVCLAVLWGVKASAIGILFPIFIGLLVPVRMLAGKYFNDEHLDALDSEEEPEDEDTHYSS